ncbi:MAG: transporter substrate-binding domain-containing protein [Proteobacteria bacterium]|nr:transporter substrate-binding domain-containing protein [Pseudomonadota bacterium]MBU4133169.1 transporter substrate-binding domain-containing protein [Pseudomonadota bacterium]
MNKLTKKCLFFSLIWFWMAFASLFPIPLGAAEMTANDLVYFTEKFPPHNYLKNGHLQGVSVEILQLIWQKLGVSKNREDIAVVPWARAIKQLETEPNMVLFGMGFTSERAKKFHWVGPYYTHELCLISKKNRGITISNLEQAKNFSIGVVRQDIGHQTLKSLGFKEKTLDLSSDLDQLHKKFIRNRFELICYAKDTYFKYLGHSGHNPDEFKVNYVISVMKSGFGFSKQIPFPLIQNFQAALDELLADQSVERILKKYDLR